MKVLILSCVMGEGHNSAAYAILEFLQKTNTDCEVLDTLTLEGKNASERASNAYLSAIRFPFFFRLTYMAGKLVSSPHRKSPVYLRNRRYSSQLEAYIRDNGFDTVITTHLFPAEALTAIKRSGKLNILTVGILTDYTCSPFWEETELDYYVIPHSDLILEFRKRGIPESKLLPYGIPVKQAFYEKTEKITARESLILKYNLKFQKEKPWYMIMSGSMGFGKIGILVNVILQFQKTDVNIIIICGTNKKLQNNLSSIFYKYSNIAVLGFVHDVPLLMDACDVLFTKPGGLSSTEAAVKNIPIIHTAPIPGCETSNAAFFSSHGMSYRSTRILKQLHSARMLCEDPAFHEYITKSQKENMNYDTCELIYHALKRMHNKEGDLFC